MFSDTSIETVRDYWNARPCNIRHSPREVGTREYFDEVEARKYFVEPHIPRFAEFERWRGKRVLEIGCGIGTDTINFARAGAQVVAVDLSERSLAVARQRAQVFGLDDKVEFYCADAEELSTVVPPAPFDLVYSFGVIHHTPHPEKVIEQIRNHYVSHGSTLKIMLYHRYSWKVFWILLTYGKGAFWKLDDLIARHSEAQTGCPITYTYSRQQVYNLLPGFEITNIWVDHIFPYRIPDYLNYMYVKNWYFHWLPAPLFRWLERTFGWHLCITAKVPGEQGKSS
ncbi:MAG: class I SAM-dependent methyltransferase [Chloroflexota bacterium]